MLILNSDLFGNYWKPILIRMNVWMIYPQIATDYSSDWHKYLDAFALGAFCFELLKKSTGLNIFPVSLPYNLHNRRFPIEIEPEFYWPFPFLLPGGKRKLNLAPDKVQEPDT